MNRGLFKQVSHRRMASLNRSRCGLLTAAATIALSSVGSSALAQNANLDDIIVTAQKREQNIQDIGLSITALGQQSLTNLGRQDVSAIVKQVPSLQVQQYSPGITVFNIRGVAQNDFTDYQEAPIAFYNDEAYISTLGAISGQTFDLQRMEVLRGPQGTLFGRNATGGLIQVITAKPTDTFQGFASVTVGSFNQISTEGAVSGPISEHVRARLSFTTDNRDGYIENSAGPDLNNARFFAVRGQVEADVGDRGKLNVKVELLRNYHQRGTGYITTPAAPNADGLGVPLAPPRADPWSGAFDEPGTFDRTFWNGLVRYEHDLDFAKFISITSYQHLKKHYVEDGDGTAAPLFRIESHQKSYQLSQEFRLNGSTDKLNWIVGLYGMKIHQDVYAPALLFGTPVINTGILNTKSLAVFAQGEYKLNDMFSFILGGRYSWDWKKFDYQIISPVPFFNFAFNTGLYPDLADQTFKNYSYKAEIDFRPADDVLVYASVNRGTKGGGFTAPTLPPPTVSAVPFKQEVLTSFEGGFKLSALDRKVTLNGAIFHYDYKDYQAFAYVGLSELIRNNPAKIDGAELELSARPVKALSLNAFATHLFRAKVYDVTLPAGTFVPWRQIPQAPDWSVGGGVTLDLPVGNLGDLKLGTNWKYDSAQIFSTFNAPVDDEPSRVVGDVRVTFAPSGTPWEASFFVNNVTNRKYRVYSLDVSALLGTSTSVYGKPRWFGGTFTYHFGK